MVVGLLVRLEQLDILLLDLVNRIDDGLLVRLEQLDILLLDLVNRIDDLLLIAVLCSFIL